MKGDQLEIKEGLLVRSVIHARFCGVSTDLGHQGSLDKNKVAGPGVIPVSSARTSIEEWRAGLVWADGSIVEVAKMTGNPESGPRAKL